MHKVVLAGYQATPNGCGLVFGTWGSRGVEQVCIEAAPSWAGLTVTATFINGDYQSEPQLVPLDGVLDVPAGATAQPTTPGAPGKIVFRGTDAERTIYSLDVPFRVLQRSDFEDANASGEPERDAWAAFVAEVQEDRAAAEAAQARAESAAAQAEHALSNNAGWVEFGVGQDGRAYVEQHGLPNVIFAINNGRLEVNT